jgi:hypothetical protein
VRGALSAKRAGKKFCGGGVEKDAAIGKGMSAEVVNASQWVAGDELGLAPGLPFVWGATGTQVEEGMGMVGIAKKRGAMEESQ